MGVNVAVLPSDVSVTAVPSCRAVTSLRAFSGVQATSANCVLMRSTTTGPCASICCTIVVTCVSVCVEVVVDDEARPEVPPLVLVEGVLVPERVEPEDEPGDVASVRDEPRLPEALPLAEPLKLPEVELPLPDEGEVAEVEASGCVLLEAVPLPELRSRLVGEVEELPLVEPLLPEESDEFDELEEEGVLLEESRDVELDEGVDDELDEGWLALDALCA